jgi:hypothetical protein
MVRLYQLGDGDVIRWVETRGGSTFSVYNFGTFEMNRERSENRKLVGDGSDSYRIHINPKPAFLGPALGP